MRQMTKQDVKNLKAFAALERLSKSCELTLNYDNHDEDFADYLLQCCGDLEALVVENDDEE